MAARNCLVLAYPDRGEPYVVSPSAKGETHFSKKEAQRTAAAHVRDLKLVRADVVEVVLEVNPQTA